MIFEVVLCMIFEVVLCMIFDVKKEQNAQQTTYFNSSSLMTVFLKKLAIGQHKITLVKILFMRL